MKYISKYNKLEEFLKELDTFNLNKNDYAIFGSGPLAVRGFIIPSDLDVIIKPSKYKYNQDPKIIGNIEFAKSWPMINIEELINTSEIINGYPYVELKYVIQYKKFFNRYKDKIHLKSFNFGNL